MAPDFIQLSYHPKRHKCVTRYCGLSVSAIAVGVLQDPLSQQCECQQPRCLASSRQERRCADTDNEAARNVDRFEMRNDGFALVSVC